MNLERSVSLVLLMIAAGCAPAPAIDVPAPDEPAITSLAASGPLCAGDPNNPTIPIAFGAVELRWVLASRAGTGTLFTAPAASTALPLFANHWRPVSAAGDKVLWARDDGRVSLWTVDVAGNFVSNVDFQISAGGGGGPAPADSTYRGPSGDYQAVSLGLVTE